MPDASLPSSYRRPSTEELDREPAVWESEDHESPVPTAGDDTGKKISPTALARTSQCLLRGLWAVQGVAGIGPSPFTQATFQDGKEFERLLLEPKAKEIWIRALHLSLRIELPSDLPIHKGKELKITSGESAQTFFERAAKDFSDTIKDKSAPFAIHEPTLACNEAGAALRGKPDLLIWTGAQWLIADIKCSEEARRTHGIQIAAYARMLKAMRPNEPIDPRGVVIHCAGGYRFTADSSPSDRATTLSHTQATPFPIAALTPFVEEEISFLLDAHGKSEARAVAEAVFSSVCNECEFRYRCYPRFLESKHVSLVPLLKAELDVIIGVGITTIDDLTDSIGSLESKEYETLLELKEGSTLQLRFLREKAEKVLASGLYSAWRAAPDATQTPLFFVSIGDEYLFEPALTPETQPTCLVVYSEAERRRAWAEMKNVREGWGIPEFVLSKEIQQTLHGPIPSLTLRPLAGFLEWAKGRQSLANLQDWLLRNHSDSPENYEKSLQESTDLKPRLKELMIVWDYLQSADITFSITPLVR